jgi:hypothetical protein
MVRRSAKVLESESALLQRARDWPQYLTLESLSAEAIQQVTQQEGIDFATALLFDRFCKSPRHEQFIRRMDALRKNPAREPRKLDLKVVVVPGALHVERPDMGGDGRLVREVASTLGWSTDLIPLASVGSVTENARRIRDWLTQRSGEKMILVSLSKAGAEVKMALASPNATELFRDVVAWINVCGPLDGSRMANWVLDSRLRTWMLRLQYLLQRRDFGFISELRHGSNAPLNFPLRLPPSMRVVSMMGFPLRTHLTTPFSRFCHRTLSRHGPNVGTTLLCDLQQWPGEVYPVWGMDHYFRPEAEARNLVAAMFSYLGAELSR